MNILLIGNGAREHAIAEALHRSPQCGALLTFANKLNPAIKVLSSRYQIGDLSDLEAITAFATEHRADFAIAGPEGPIAAGVADKLEAAGVPCVAPKKSLARLESSKGFTRELLARHNIPGNPRFRVFETDEGMAAFAETLGQFVVKADGLHSGKGVHVMGDHFATVQEGVAIARDYLKTDGRVVLEEKLIGQEFSLMSFCDGTAVADLPPVQDHKRAFKEDKGPNTGGMGSYSTGKLLPFLGPHDLEAAHQITARVAQALRQECGEGFKGVLYGGFIAVKDGVRLIEYNVRFGDPEAMNVLPLLKTDFVEICRAILNGKLTPEMAVCEERATVCKYVVPEGYPDHPKSGAAITFAEAPAGCRAYMASVDAREGAIHLSSSRAVAFVGIAPTLSEAEQLAQQGVETVQGPVFYRNDIGTEALIQKRVEMMKELRG